MEQQKKRRAENWSSEEKEILRQFITQSRNIIEDKSNKASANIEKAKEWKNIASKFNEITGKNRTDGDLKLAWKRMKLAAKANISAHRQKQMQTGGGEKPKSPSQEDLAIMEIAPHDFVIEINDYDSDAVAVMAESRAHNFQIVAGPSTSHETLTNIGQPELPQQTCEIEVVPDQDDSTIHKVKGGTAKKGRILKKKQGPLNIKEVMQQSIVDNNILFKKRQLEMLEQEHEYNIKIAKLKVKKLELQISKLENEKTKINDN